MNADAKRTLLHTIPDGISVMTAGNGNLGPATENSVIQVSFAPLVVAGVKTDSGACPVIKGTGQVTLNMIAKDQKRLAFTIVKSARVDGGKRFGQDICASTNGVPILDAAIGAVECKLRNIIERGAPHIVVGEVIEPHPMRAPDGRADAATPEMTDLGDNIYYGG